MPIEVPSVHTALSQKLLDLLDEREKALNEAIMVYNQKEAQYKLVMQFMQDVQNGTVPWEVFMDRAQTVISDDGWQLVPPEPVDEPEEPVDVVVHQNGNGVLA